MLTELVELRTRNSKTFDLGNGKRAAEIFADAIHYKDNYADPTELWKDIDLTWIGNRIDKAPYILVLDGNKITVTDKETNNVSTIERINVKPPFPFEIVPDNTRVMFRHTLLSDKIPFEVQFKVTGSIPLTSCAYDDEGELELESTLTKGILIEKLASVKDKATGKVRPVRGNIRIDPTLTVYSSVSDGYIGKSDAAYNTAWTATTGTVEAALTTVVIGQRWVSPTYYIYRGFVFFDTSSIPSGATISLATLSLYGYADNSVTDFLITIQNGQPTWPTDPLAITDYNKENYSGDGGSLTTVGFLLTAYNVITLNATGRGWIQKGAGAKTKLCLRSSRDIAGTAPTGEEYVVVYATEEVGTDKDPKLYVEYTVTYLLSCTDGLKAGDTPIAQCSFGVSCSEGLTGGDAIQHNFPDVADGVKLSDTITNNVIFNTMSASDGATLSETLATWLQSYPTVIDGIKLSDTAVHYLTLSLLASDGIKVSDLASIHKAMVIYALLELYSRALIAKLYKRNITVIQEE